MENCPWANPGNVKKASETLVFLPPLSYHQKRQNVPKKPKYLPEEDGTGRKMIAFEEGRKESGGAVAYGVLFGGGGGGKN
jgi:hypothetical protein